MSHEEAKKELLNKRVPEVCPFCKSIDEIEWTEFDVFLGEKFYFEKRKDYNTKVREVDIRVFCTRCDEEIREEDL